MNEALIALAVLGVLLGGVARLAGSCSAGERRLARHLGALCEAVSLLEAGTADPGDGSGRVGVHPVPGGVEVRVAWDEGEGGQARCLRLRGRVGRARR